jgi:hypothetical protein
MMLGTLLPSQSSPPLPPATVTHLDLLVTMVSKILENRYIYQMLCCPIVTALHILLLSVHIDVHICILTDI